MTVKFTYTDNVVALKVTHYLYTYLVETLLGLRSYIANNPFPAIGRL